MSLHEKLAKLSAQTAEIEAQIAAEESAEDAAAARAFSCLIHSFPSVADAARSRQAVADLPARDARRYQSWLARHGTAAATEQAEHPKPEHKLPV